MKDFLIAFSASTAAIAGIIFAFLISKALGFESAQSDVLDSAEKKILDIKKINSKLFGISNLKFNYNGTEADLLEKYVEKLEQDYSKWESRGLEHFIEYIKGNKVYHLQKDILLEKLNEEKDRFLERKYEALKKIIENSLSREITSLYDLKKYPQYNILKNSAIYLIQLEDDLKNKNCKIESELERLVRLSTDSIRLGDKDLVANFLSPNQYKEKEIQKQIGELLVDYIYKKEELKYSLKKMTSLKKERDNIYIFLIIAYFMIVFGVIYPLSYIKFTNEIELDYTIYNNFFSELFSVSGFMLAVLFAIFSGFSLRIYSLIDFNNELVLMIKKLKNQDFIDNKNYIIENFELCESYKEK